MFPTLQLVYDQSNCIPFPTGLGASLLEWQCCLLSLLVEFKDDFGDLLAFPLAPPTG